ncbi:MAG: hypothetical protein JWO80_5511 [Bryobacterales bacterium]|nr:hypothetical protein [Bryobacterales bacterium]
MSPREQLGGAAPAKRDHRQEVTDSIVKMLEDGVAPWQKPWESAGMPFNPTTDKSYGSVAKSWLYDASAFFGLD